MTNKTSTCHLKPSSHPYRVPRIPNPVQLWLTISRILLSPLVNLNTTNRDAFHNRLLAFPRSSTRLAHARSNELPLSFRYFPLLLLSPSPKRRSTMSDATAAQHNKASSSRTYPPPPPLTNQCSRVGWQKSDSGSPSPPPGNALLFGEGRLTELQYTRA